MDTPSTNLEKIIEEKVGIEHIVGKRCASWLCSRHAGWVLGVISFIESVFAPIIIDPFLVALILATPKKWKWYTFIAIISSVIGGIFAYFLGAVFFDTIGIKFIALYGLEETFASISKSLDNNGFVFVFVGAFTPVPYKLVALASGLLHIDLVTFITASVIGRVLRLVLVAYAAYAVGPKTLPIIQRNLHLLAAVLGLILILYIVYNLL